ncbi:MAG: diaminopimelate decarboxylase [Phycisphaeraceae bacterium]
MDFFQYRDGQLYAEDVNLDTLADQLGTPLYVYSRKTFEDHYGRIAEAFAPLDPTLCYSIKSCGNINILKLLVARGAGMDVVSGGELRRAQAAGADMSKIVYAGVGKTDAEITAALEAGIGYFNIESEAEFENIARLAEQTGHTTHAALRVNPDVDPKTHTYTTTGKKESKFGVDLERARRFFESYGKNPHCRLTAVHIHIGSPVNDPQPYVDAINKVLALIDDLRAAGYTVDTLDIGGGFGAHYESDEAPPAVTYAERIVPLLKDRDLKVILEPGRSIAANAGVLLSRVQYIKTGGDKKFVIVDAGMNTLLRPSLYQAFHFLWPTKVDAKHVPEQRLKEMPNADLEPADVVGPICETGDFFAQHRALPPVKRGDLIAVFAAGAYGMVMASNYNAMPRPAEVLVDGDNATIIRHRETYEDLLAHELEPQSV